MSVVWHIAVYAFAVIGAVSVLAQAPKATAARRARRHDALMARIAKLEIANGFGLDYAADWAESQGPDWVRLEKFNLIAVLRCRGCGREFERQGDRLETLALCRKCRGL